MDTEDEVLVYEPPKVFLLLEESEIESGGNVDNESNDGMLS